MNAQDQTKKDWHKTVQTFAIVGTCLLTIGLVISAFIGNYIAYGTWQSPKAPVNESKKNIPQQELSNQETGLTSPSVKPELSPNPTLTVSPTPTPAPKAASSSVKKKVNVKKVIPPEEEVGNYDPDEFTSTEDGVKYCRTYVNGYPLVDANDTPVYHPCN